MPERSHLSIGEVLSLLREEFPDVTISKIRFLESQGLVDPERTPSGYRKFYDHDVERLRWILRQQRENFLPLKIIRGRLTEQGEDIDENGSDGGYGPEEIDRPVVDESAGDSEVVLPAAGAERTIEEAAVTHPSAGARQAGGPPPAPPPSLAPPPPPPPPPPPGRSSPVAAGDSAPSGPAGAESRPPARSDAVESGPERTAAGRGSGRWLGPPPSYRTAPGASAGSLTSGSRGRSAGPGPLSSAAEDTETYSIEELASASGGTVAMVTQLQEFGLIGIRTVVGGTPYFDAAALAVVRAAAGFSRYGVEARHLRAWRNAADREAGLFEQVIMPLLRQRNPEARRQATAALSELTSLGGDLRKALLEQAVRDIH